MEQKTEIPGVYKVAEGVLINKDKGALAAYKQRKQKEQKINCMEKQLHNLKQDIEEIKMLLRGLVK
jgi:hypothetical protein